MCARMRRGRDQAQEPDDEKDNSAKHPRA